jgi:hypothetical protein
MVNNVGSGKDPSVIILIFKSMIEELLFGMAKSVVGPLFRRSWGLGIYSDINNELCY